MNIEINKIVSNIVQTKLNDIYSYKNFNLKEEDIFDNNKSLEYFKKYHGSRHKLLDYSTNSVFEIEKFLDKLELNIKLYYGNVNLAYMNNFANIYISVSEITFYTNTNLIVKISGILPSDKTTTIIVLTTKTHDFSFTLFNGINNIPEDIQNCNIEKYKTLISQYLIYTIDPKIYVDYLLICENDCINDILFDNEHIKEKFQYELNESNKDNLEMLETINNLETDLEQTQLNYQYEIKNVLHNLENILHKFEITSEELTKLKAVWKKTQEHSNKLQQDLEETQQDLVTTYQELNKFKNISEKTQQDLETTFQELDTLKIKLDLQENVIYIKNIIFILMFIVLLIVLPYLF